MKKLTKAQDLIKELKYVSPEDYNEIKENTEKVKQEFRGGYRENAGRKCISSTPRKYTIRVTDDEKSFIDLIRAKSIDIEILKQKFC